MTKGTSTSSSTMKAVRLHEYGGPQVLRYEDAPRPEPGAKQVVVRVLAAGVNPFDWKVRAGYMKDMMPLSLPWIPGVDFSGKVESVGSGVTTMRVGDEVYGRSDPPGNGCYAEYVVVPDSAVAPKPRSLTHVHSAALMTALTAWQMLFGLDGPGVLPDKGGSGKSVLVLGAAGGVGSFVVQLAKNNGARIIAVARPGQGEHLRALGADEVIENGGAGLQAAGPVDAVVDLVGGELQKQAFAALKSGGALASTMGPPDEAMARAVGVRPIAVYTRTSAKQLAEIAATADAGKLRVPLSRTMPLASAQQAHELLESHGTVGKVVLTMTDA